jgi:hypothetical protein
MIKKLLLTAALLAPGLAYGQVSAPLDPPVTPTGQGPTPPPQAVAAGFTTLAANWDWTTGQMCVYDGRSPACVPASPLSNWLETTGDTNSAYQWHCDNSALPCNVSIITDGSVSVLDAKYLQSYGGFGRTGGQNYVEITTVLNNNNPPYGPVVFPPGLYIEAVYRQVALTPNRTASNLSVFGYSTGANSFDAEPGELYNTNSVAADGSAGNFLHPGQGFIWDSPTTPTLPGGYSNLAYHKYADLITNNHSNSIIACAYADDIWQKDPATFNGCHDLTPTSGQIDNRYEFNITTGANWSPYPDADEDLLVKYIRIWSCATWTTTQCPGSTLSDNGAGFQYWH